MKKPNILFVFTDQQRFDTISALGNNNIRTPVLDSIVRNGVSFTKAYTPCPVCVPARFTMHTGMMPHVTGIVENSLMPEGRKSFMDILSENGYQTFGTGKMHFNFKTGLNTKWGFDKRAVCEGEYEDLEDIDYYQDIKKYGFEHVVDFKGIRSEMYYVPQTSQLPKHLQHSAWTVDKSIDFLKQRDKDKPFFLMTSFEKPHPPFEPPVPWNKVYRGPEMPLPKRPKDSEQLMTLWNRYQNRYKYRDQGIDDNLIRQIKAYYYAEVSFIDYNLGRLLAYLDHEQCLENTVIIYTSDHGEMLGDYNCFGKRCFLDSAARIPMIMYYPGCPTGLRIDTPVSLLDIMPTILQFADIKPNESYQGESLMGFVNGNATREDVFGQYQAGRYASYMVVNKEYKYIYSVPDQKEFLFDLMRDPYELENRAQNTLYIKKTKEMREKIINYYENEDYIEAVENGNWKEYPKFEFTEDSQAYLLYQDNKCSMLNSPMWSSDEKCKGLSEDISILNYLSDLSGHKYSQFSWLK